MAKRVAITIAGAVSLGSYEAGVTYELLEAVRQKNAQATSEVDKIYVDVITGASAGGMTAAILGQWLMFRGDEMSSACGNPLYRAWVKRITLEELVKLQATEDPWHSLFSSDLITQIGKEMLIDSMVDAPGKAHACVEPGRPLRIGVAMTNLNGVDYMMPIEGSDDEGFNYTRSVDQRLFTITPGGTAGPLMVTPEGVGTLTAWSTLREAAVSCGAFPFAFRPQQVQRVEAEYVNSVTPAWPGSASLAKPGTTYVTADPLTQWSFAYSDGGVLQNQPLGIAKDLVDASVRERLSEVRTRLEEVRGSGEEGEVRHALGKVHRDADDRIYVFISPNEVKSSATGLLAETISMSKMLPVMVQTYLRQAAFHDWIMAETVNQKIRILDDRAQGLADALRSGVIDNLEAFQISAAKLDDLLLGAQQAQTFERLQHQYDKLYAELEAVPGRGPALAKAFVQGIAALEAAAHLGDRDKMHIVAVLADGKTELAGSGLSAFVGFFSEIFRQHDYLVGRKKAREYLLRPDVVGLMGTDAVLLKAGYDASPLPDPAGLVVVPLSRWRMFEAGRRWLGFAVWLRLRRLWVWLLFIAVVLLAMLYFVLACWFHCWPFATR